MRISSGSIGAFHERLARALRKGFGHSVAVSPKPGHEAWERFAFDREVVFFARPKDQAHQHVGGAGSDLWPPMLLVADVLPVEGAQLWAAWREGWLAAGAGQFKLSSVRWDFSWGHNLRPLVQVLRAEWYDQEQGAGRAPQPHWHFDQPLLIDAGILAPPTEGEDGGAEVRLSGLHLGMGGWENTENEETCWQMPLLEDPAVLVAWADRTLRQARSEFRRLAWDRP